jgi:hypothetical protein
VIGGEQASDGRITSETLRATAGIAATFARTRVLDNVRPRPTVGALVTASIGDLDDDLGGGRHRKLGYLDVGILLDVGLRAGDPAYWNDRVYDRLFLTFGPLLTHEWEGSDPAVHGTLGLRAALGFNFAKLWYDIYTHDWSVYALICPQQWEVVWDGTAGSNRFGVAFSWGI